MSNNVAEFIEWWARMTVAERRRRIAEARERRSYWMRRRALVLFGLLESDAMNNDLELLPVVVRGFSSDEVIARFRGREDAQAFVDACLNVHGGVLTIEEER